MAENDWYEKHKKDVAVALKKGKGAAKDDGVPCTLVKMKDGSALLCAAVSSSKAAALVKEAKGAGGKVLSTGTLYKGDAGPTFAVADGSTSVKALFSAAAAEAAGSPLNVTIVAVTPSGETASAPPPPPPPPGAPPPPTADGEKGQFTDLLRQVRPRFQQVLAADPPNKASLEKGMGLAVAAAKENDFGKGLKLLQAVDVALQKTPLSTGSVPPPPPPTKSAPTPPPPPPPPSSSPPQSGTAPIQAALAKMLPLVKNAAAANPDRKTELLEPLKRCQDHIKNNQAAEAKTALFDLNRVLKDLNGSVPPPPPPPPPTGKAPTTEAETEGKEEEREEAETKEGESSPEVKEVSEQEEEEQQEEEKSGSDTTAELKKETGEQEKEEQQKEEQQEEEKSGSDTTAELKEETGEQEEEEQEEEQISGTSPTDTEAKEETGEQEEEEEKSGTAPTTEDEEEEATTTVGVWVDARDKVITQMQALQAACGKECQETGDPDFDLIADKGLAAITKRMQVGLHVALMEFDRASGDGKAKAQAKAQKVVTDFQTFLGSDRMVKLAEENPFGVKVEIRSTLGAALDRLSKTLGA